MMVGARERAVGGSSGAKKSLKLLGHPYIINISHERWRRQQQGGNGSGGRLGKGVEQNRN